MDACNVQPRNFRAVTQQCGPLLFAIILLLTSACSSTGGPSSELPPPPAPPAPVEAPPPPPPPVVVAPPPPPATPASPPPPPTAVELPVPDSDQANKNKVEAPGYHLIPVHFASDRKLVGTKYGTEKNRKPGHVTYGVVNVSIPDVRKPAEIPLQPWYHIFGENPKKWVYVRDITPLSEIEFFGSLKNSLDKVPERRLAFIYVHGFNNSFDDAARRAAQISLDLDLPSVPVFYTWPSRESPLRKNYQADEETVVWSEPHLLKFFEDFADKSSATDIYVIAHSLGNRPTTGALADLIAKRPDLLRRFKSIILAAPDINVDEFNDNIAPVFASLKIPTTVYMSRKDKALLASAKTHSGNRLGEGRKPIDEIAGFDVVDVSAVNTNFMGHDYVSSNTKFLADVAKIIREGSVPAARGLKGMPSTPFKYWELTP